MGEKLPAVLMGENRAYALVRRFDLEDAVPRLLPRVCRTVRCCQIPMERCGTCAMYHSYAAEVRATLAALAGLVCESPASTPRPDGGAS